MRTGTRTADTPASASEKCDLGGIESSQIRGHRVKINAKPRQHFAHVTAVDHGEMNTGDKCLELRLWSQCQKPARRDSIFVIAVLVRNSGTRAFDIAHG